MLRFIARHGLVRLIGGRAVPALLIWDLAMLANKTRRIPAVDRGLRRGAGVAVKGFQSVTSSRPSVPPRPRPSGPGWRDPGKGNRRSSSGRDRDA